MNLTNLKLLQTELSINDAMDAYEALVIHNGWQREMNEAATKKRDE